jgi:hypothetical protein
MSFVELIPRDGVLIQFGRRVPSVIVPACAVVAIVAATMASAMTVRPFIPSPSGLTAFRV